MSESSGITKEGLSGMIGGILAGAWSVYVAVEFIGFSPLFAAILATVLGLTFFVLMDRIE